MRPAEDNDCISISNPGMFLCILSQLILRRRARYRRRFHNNRLNHYFNGRTSKRTPAINVRRVYYNEKRPSLAGIGQKTPKQRRLYHREYMRLLRAQMRKLSLQPHEN